MRPSRSKYVELESMPINALLQLEAGSTALYKPAPDEQGKTGRSLTRIATNAKSAAAKANKTCSIQTVLILTYEDGKDLPSPSKLLQVTVTNKCSAKGQRYRTANRIK